MSTAITGGIERLKERFEACDVLMFLRSDVIGTEMRKPDVIVVWVARIVPRYHPRQSTVLSPRRGSNLLGCSPDCATRFQIGVARRSDHQPYASRHTNAIVSQPTSAGCADVKCPSNDQRCRSFDQMCQRGSETAGDMMSNRDIHCGCIIINHTFSFERLIGLLPVCSRRRELKRQIRGDKSAARGSELGVWTPRKGPRGEK